MLILPVEGLEVQAGVAPVAPLEVALLVQLIPAAEVVGLPRIQAGWVALVAQGL